MSADSLLSRLEGVKRTGPDRWIARCPAHEDRNPSLAVRELGDGRTLVRCFAECGTADVLGAVGLEFDALFPARAIAHSLKPERRPFPAADVLQAIAFETIVVAAAASALSRGKALDLVDHARLSIAAGRLQRAAEVSYA